MKNSPAAAMGLRGLYLFVLFQVYCIPVALKGPSWAVWLTLSDICLFLSGFLFLVGFREKESPSQVDRVFRFLLILFGLCAVSFVAMTGLDILGTDPGGDRSIGVNWGMLYLYRMAEMLLAIWIVSRVPLTQGVVAMFARISAVAIVVVGLSVVGTYFSLIETSLLAPHIPDDPGVSGPWFAYKKDLIPGAGSISYNHAYTAVQALLLLILRISLAPRARTMNMALLALTFLTVLLSESRAGLVAFGVFCVLILKYMDVRRMLLTAGLAVGLVACLSFFMFGTHRDFLDEIGERYVSILDPTTSENLSDRDSIWESSLGYLNKEPYRWVIGSGFGSQVGEVGNNAHMTYLQLVVECGLVGLLIFGLFFRRVLRVAGQFGHVAKPMLYGTIALLVSACTQETFYPVPSLGCFLSLYFFAFAIAIRSYEEELVHL